VLKARLLLSSIVKSPKDTLSPRGSSNRCGIQSIRAVARGGPITDPVMGCVEPGLRSDLAISILPNSKMCRGVATPNASTLSDGGIDTLFPSHPGDWFGTRHASNSGFLYSAKEGIAILG
jgi:hypothetical protein